MYASSFTPCELIRQQGIILKKTPLWCTSRFWGGLNQVSINTCARGDPRWRFCHHWWRVFARRDAIIESHPCDAMMSHYMVWWVDRGMCDVNRSSLRRNQQSVRLWICGDVSPSYDIICGERSYLLATCLSPHDDRRLLYDFSLNSNF